MTLAKTLQDLAGLRDSDEVLVYFTSDKQPLELFSTQIATDIVPIFDKHLYKIGKKKKISLFLYSSGGSLDTPWPLVCLLREYCKELEVVIPFKALSAATLICLGADEIVMTPLSSLSPIDPQGNYMVGQEVKNIQVEDVTGFIDFTKSKVGIDEQGALTEVMKVLSSEIPPSKLGSINRTHSLIRLLADNLLRRHIRKLEEHQIKTLIENLTEKLFSHQHLIGRYEAKYKIGFKRLIKFSKPEEEKIIRELFQYFKDLLQLETIFNPEKILGSSQEERLKLPRAVIHSSKGTDAFMTDYVIQRVQNPNAPKPFGIKLENIGWEEISIK